MRILLVEDDPLLGDGLAAGLRQAGFATDWLKDGESADAALKTEAFDLIVLDLGLPRLAGMEVLKKLRGRGSATPVLILTARDATPDKVAGLDAGADDFLVKPVDLDPAAHAVSLAGKPVELSGREFAILAALLENAGRVLTRAQLEANVYGWTAEPDSNAVEVHIHHLRRKLGGTLIKTLRGVGYLIDKA